MVQRLLPVEFSNTGLAQLVEQLVSKTVGVGVRVTLNPCK